MSEKLALLLLLIFPISVGALGNTSLDFFGDFPGNGTIILEGNDMITMPKMNLPEEAKGMELFNRFPVYSLNQSIIGTFLFSSQEEASNASNISACISPLNLSFYLSGYEKARGFGDEVCTKILPNSNSSANGNGLSFQMSASHCGIYSLDFIDENKSRVLVSVPLLIMEGQTVLQMQRNVNANEPFIQVKMNTTAQGNQSKIFAAVMVSRKDYENASLGMAINETSKSYDLALSLGSKSLQIQGPPKITSELLMSLLPLLPANSAVGLQESTQFGVDLILLPDKSWEKGGYILTCAVYSPGKGLLGIKQQEVEVV
jgi:hypothetical protein